MTAPRETRPPLRWRLARAAAVVSVTVPLAVLCAGLGALVFAFLEGFSTRGVKNPAIAVGVAFRALTLVWGVIACRAVRRHLRVPYVLAGPGVALAVAGWDVALYLALRSRDFGGLTERMPTVLRWLFWSGLTVPAIAAGAVGLIVTAVVARRWAPVRGIRPLPSTAGAR